MPVAAFWQQGLAKATLLLAHNRCVMIKIPKGKENEKKDIFIN